MGPDPEEFEVTVFGPGYGECVVVHLGHGAWGIVDSCVDKSTGQPRALQYFDELGVDPSTSVRFIVATHWHDDHVRGLADLLESCETAEFWLSDALRSDEFLRVVKARGKRTLLSISGASEMERVLEILDQRKEATGSTGHRYAVEGRPIWTRESAPVVRVQALTPSDAAIDEGRTDIAGLLPERNRPRNAVPTLTTNHAGIAIWIDFSGQHVLLGDDLEHSPNPNIGWQGVVRSRMRPDANAGLVKIAHHGSENGHSEEFWNELAPDQPVGMLAPFSRGNIELPTENGVSLLCERTSSLYASAALRPPSSRKRSGALGKEVKAATRWIRDTLRPAGRLTARWKVGASDWVVELEEPALQIC